MYCDEAVFPRIEDYKPALTMGSGVGIEARDDIVGKIKKVEYGLFARRGLLYDAAEELRPVYHELCSGRAMQI